LINVGILLFGAVVLFQLITLPVEFNASRRALSVLDESEALVKEEIPASCKFQQHLNSKPGGYEQQTGNI